MCSAVFPSRVPLSLAALILIPIFLTGCGGPALVPVSGKVLLDGKALTSGGAVRFTPDESKGNTSKLEPVGKIAEDGTYTMETNGKPGAPAGAYKVVVSAQGPPVNPNDPYSLPKHIINKKYGQEATTDLSVTVVANAAPDAYDLKVTK
jgi:hypothetical protein